MKWITKMFFFKVEYRALYFEEVLLVDGGEMGLCCICLSANRRPPFQRSLVILFLISKLNGDRLTSFLTWTWYQYLYHCHFICKKKIWYSYQSSVPSSESPKHRHLIHLIDQLAGIEPKCEVQRSNTEHYTTVTPGWLVRTRYYRLGCWRTN